MLMQRTPEWFEDRLGKVTASRVSDIIAETKSGPSASRANYMAELIAERLTGTPNEGFSNDAMAWGTDNEPLAIERYCFENLCTVVPVGFVAHPTIGMTGASPDGEVNDDGLIEVKCPNTKTHIATLRGGSIPKKYVVQMQWQMACTGRAWCDFASFDPRLPPEMQLYVKRVVRDDAMIVELERAVSSFLDDVDAAVTELTEQFMKEAK